MFTKLHDRPIPTCKVRVGPMELSFCYKTALARIEVMHNLPFEPHMYIHNQVIFFNIAGTPSLSGVHYVDIRCTAPSARDVAVMGGTSSNCQDKHGSLGRRGGLAVYYSTIQPRYQRTDWQNSTGNNRRLTRCLIAEQNSVAKLCLSSPYRRLGIHMTCPNRATVLKHYVTHKTGST